jgi:hypothetical protein
MIGSAGARPESADANNGPRSLSALHTAGWGAWETCFARGTKSTMTAFSGFIARKNGQRVKLYSRPGNDLTPRFPQIVGALARLRPRCCIIDGEAVACGEDGVACFELIRR